jgi:hypothetical protein
MSDKKSGRERAKELNSSSPQLTPTKSKKAVAVKEESPTPTGGSEPEPPPSTKRTPTTKGKTMQSAPSSGTLLARAAVPKSLPETEGEQPGSPESGDGSPKTAFRRTASRHSARPWKPSTPHPTSAEQREPKGWTLSHILSKAKLSFAMSKVFAPHIDLTSNRIKVGVRFRPMNELEIRRGEKEKSKEFIKMSGNQIKMTNPRPCSVCMQGKAQASSSRHPPHTLPPFPASGDDEEGPRVPLPPPLC